MKLVELTDSGNNKKILINPELISAVLPCNPMVDKTIPIGAKSKVFFIGVNVIVTETLDQIKALCSGIGL